MAEKIVNPGFRLPDGKEITTEPFIVKQVDNQVIGYAVVDSPAELTHEEHPTITIPAGIYEIRRQREYDEKEIRFVED